MNLEKLNRIASAITAGCVLLLFILLSVMVYQMVAINAKNAKIQELKTQKAELEEKREKITDDIELWLSEWKIEERARELNYSYPEDKK